MCRAELAFELSDVHTFGLDGFEDIDADFDQVRNERGEMSAAVEGDLHVAADRPDVTHNPFVPRTIPLAIHCRTHDE